jgi:hypothetical protein
VNEQPWETNIEKLRGMYRNDPHFHAVVDAMRAWIYRTEVTPAEVRGAAMLACLMHEETRVRHYVIPSESLSGSGS